MTEDHFWQIIQRSFDSCNGNIDDQAETLTGELAPLSAEEVASFDECFERFRRKAYSWDLWGAAYIIEGGCSDDCFMDFRSWLISRGRDWFQRALRDPDTLADYPADLQEGGASFEEFAYVASRVHEEKAGDIPAYELPPHPQEPAGEPWPEDDEESFRSRWPKLFKKYWAA